jgi:lipid kinase YegS
MRTLWLILNGKGAELQGVRTAVEAVRAAGHLLDVRVTWEAGQASDFAREAAASGVDVVVAGGGDGTVNEIVQGLLSKSDPKTPALAILPLGTANDLARGLNVPLDDPLAALTLAAEGVISAIDVGFVNDRPFVNVASGGFGAEVTARTSPELKNALGSAAYSITGLLTAAQLAPYPCRLVAQRQSLDLNVVLLAIGNGRLAGGGYEVAPQAHFDDGLLDLVIAPAVTLGEIPQLLGELFNVTHEHNQYILYRQLAAFELHFADEFQLNLDGEGLRAKDFDVAVRQTAISVVVKSEILNPKSLTHIPTSAPTDPPSAPETP